MMEKYGTVGVRVGLGGLEVGDGQEGRRDAHASRSCLGSCLCCRTKYIHYD